MKVDDTTPITVPLRNLIAVGVGLCLFMGQWFVLDNRVSKLESDVLRLLERESKNTEFRYVQTPKDTEQTIRLSHIEAAILRLEDVQ